MQFISFQSCFSPNTLLDSCVFVVFELQFSLKNNGEQMFQIRELEA